MQVHRFLAKPQLNLHAIRSRHQELGERRPRISRDCGTRIVTAITSGRDCVHRLNPSDRATIGVNRELIVGGHMPTLYPKEDQGL
jgi:hypothetical protein